MAGTEKKRRGQRSDRHRAKFALVRRAIENIENKIEADDVKATIGDFIRLLQLEKELEEEIPREIKVTWVEPGKTEPAIAK